MTIALGILAEDGLVIAADSEVTQGDYMSVGGQKVVASLHLTNNPGQDHGNVIVAGAGDAGYLDALYPEVTQIFKDSLDLDAFSGALQKFLTGFYREHIIPFSGERPYISLIVGARRGEDIRLWTTVRNRVIPCRGTFTAIGAGEMYARGILEQLCGQQNTTVSRLMAAYVIFHVKDRIPGCGKHTHVASITQSDFIPETFGPNRCMALEALFRRYGQVEAVLLHKMFGGVEGEPWEKLPSILSSLADEIKKT